MIRGEVLSLKERDFVRLAHRGRLLEADDHAAAHPAQRRSTPLIVLVTLQIGFVIIVEASLSFLGVGVPPPKPAWG